MRAYRSINLSLFLVSQIVQNFYFLYCKQTIAIVGGKKKKKANAKSPMERERERERDLCEAKCFCNCVGDLVMRYINKVFDFFNFSTAVVQVIPRYVGMKIRIFFPLLFVEVIVKIPICSF